VTRLRQESATAGSPAASRYCDSLHSDIAVATITALTLERQSLRDGLRDLLLFYDIVTGEAPKALRRRGWSTAEVLRLAEIRSLLEGPQMVKSSQ
jgi:hypothetical protein